MAHGAGPTSNGNWVSAGRYWRVRSTNTPYVPPRMCGGRVLLSGTRGGADVKREPGLCRALVACPLNEQALRSAADVCGGRVLLSGTRGGADVKRELGLCRALVACPLNQHALRSAADVCGGRVLLSGTRGRADVKREPGHCHTLVVCPHNQHTVRPAADVWGAGITEWPRGGADVKPEPGLCRALVVCPLNQHTLHPAADVWGAGITEWHTGRGRRQMGPGSVAHCWCVRPTNTPYVPTRMGGGRVLLSGTRAGADVKREPDLCRALVACPLNQHTLRPAADVWGAGITEWHTGRGRRQTGTGSLWRAGGVSAQPTHPTSRRGCVGGGYY